MVVAASGGDSLFAWFVVSGGKTDTWFEESTGCFINTQIWKKGYPFPSTGLEPFIKCPSGGQPSQTIGGNGRAMRSLHRGPLLPHWQHR